MMLILPEDQLTAVACFVVIPYPPSPLQNKSPSLIKIRTQCPISAPLADLGFGIVFLTRSLISVYC